MNYDEYIHQLIEALKADKGLAQPYKNYLISDAKRLQVAVRGTKTMAMEKAPADVLAEAGTGDAPLPMQFAGPMTSGTAGQCVCTTGMPPRKDCPVHGAS